RHDPLRHLLSRQLPAGAFLPDGRARSPDLLPGRHPRAVRLSAALSPLAAARLGAELSLHAARAGRGANGLAEGLPHRLDRADVGVSLAPERKVALVTCASRGIGRALAAGFARA